MYADLKRILSSQPSTNSWNELKSFFVDNDVHGDDDLVAKVRDSISDWPAELASHEMGLRAYLDTPPVYWQLISHFTLNDPYASEPAAVREFVTSPYTRHLRHLKIVGHVGGAEGVYEIVGTQLFENLEGIQFDSCFIEAEGLAALVCSFSPNIRSLIVHDGGFEKYGVIQLTDSRKLAQLETLDLSNNECVCDEAVTSLAQSQHLRGLKHLALDSCAIFDAGVIELSQSENMRHLRRLSISSNAVGLAGAEALASSPYLGELNSLSISSNTITKKGAHALIASPLLSSLKHIDMSRCRLSSKALKQLIEEATARGINLDS